MAKKTKVEPAAEPVPVRTPPKHGTFGPESGPSGEVVIAATAPAPDAIPLAHADERTKAAQEKAQKAAENVKKDRSVKVRATRRGFINKVIEEGTVFVIELEEGQTLPSWVEAEASAHVPTTPVSHSAEAKEEVVDSAGIGHTPESLVKETVQ